VQQRYQMIRRLLLASTGAVKVGGCAAKLERAGPALADFTYRTPGPVGRVEIASPYQASYLCLRIGERSRSWCIFHGSFLQSLRASCCEVFQDTTQLKSTASGFGPSTVPLQLRAGKLGIRAFLSLLLHWCFSH
jgi:hypothetical protein